MAPVHSFQPGLLSHKVSNLGCVYPIVYDTCSLQALAKLLQTKLSALNSSFAYGVFVESTVAFNIYYSSPLLKFLPSYIDIRLQKNPFYI